MRLTRGLLVLTAAAACLLAASSAFAADQVPPPPAPARGGGGGLTAAPAANQNGGPAAAAAPSPATSASAPSPASPQDEEATGLAPVAEALLTNFSTTWAVIQAARLEKLFDDPTARFTVLAPTNDAWLKRLPSLTAGANLTASQLLSDGKARVLEQVRSSEKKSFFRPAALVFQEPTVFHFFHFFIFFPRRS